MGTVVNAGQLDRRVSFDAPVVTRGASGQEQVAWNQILTVWAAVLPRTAREKLTGDQVLADVDSVIRIRYSTDAAAITPKHRARMGSITYNIHSIVNVDSANVMLELMCQSGTNQG